MRRLAPVLLCLAALFLSAPAWPQSTEVLVVAACGNQAFNAGATVAPLTVDVNGYLCSKSTGTVTSNSTEKSTAAAPTYVEGTSNPLSGDLSGNLRTLDTQGTSPWVSSLTASTTGGATTSSTIIPNNTTAIVVKGSPGQLYGIECWNNNTTIAYIKVYDAISATAGVGTPAARYMCPASSSGSGFVRIDTIGRQYLTGITYIVTTGIADNDTTAPAASTYIVNVGYK